MHPIRRRELLAAFLGAPAVLASAGCSTSSPPPPIPPGELTGSNLKFGHQLRELVTGRKASSATSSPADNANSNGANSLLSSERFASAPVRPQVIIVGAGIAGLAAARRLLSEGIDDFLVLELESKPGGKSRSEKTDVTPYPLGAHYVPSPPRENKPLVDLFDELGAFEGRDEFGEPIPNEHWLVRDPESRVFYKGLWYEGLYLHSGANDDDLQQRQRFQEEIDNWVAWRDAQGRRAFSIPSSQSSTDAEVMQLDALTMAEWMTQNGFTSQRLLWYVDYACRDDYGMRIDQASAWAGLFYFAARRRVPQGPSQPFLTWPAGNGFVVQHMFQPIKARTEVGWAVVQIAAGVGESEQNLVQVLALDERGDRRRYLTQRVIFAAPRFLAPHLLADMTPELRADAEQFQYSSWAVSNVHLQQHPQSEGFPLSWDNVLYESPSLGYVAATHQRGPHVGPTVLTHYYPLCGDPVSERQRLLNTQREDWAEVVLSDLEAGHPGIRSHCNRLDVARWGHAMIRPAPGFISGDARQRAVRPLGRVHFAHSDLSGVALFEEAFDHGWRAGGEVSAALRDGGGA